MTRVSLTFEADSWDDLMARIRAAGQAANAALLEAYEPQPLGELLKEPEAPEPEPAPAPAPRSHKKARSASPAPTPPEPAPNVPEPQPPVTAQAPAPEPEPERELPSLEALKAVVTAAVRAAQKKRARRPSSTFSRRSRPRPSSTSS